MIDNFYNAFVAQNTTKIQKAREIQELNRIVPYVKHSTQELERFQLI